MVSRIRTLGLAIAVGMATAGAPRAENYDVPGGYATLQAAVADAALSGDVENNIDISASVVYTAAAVALGADFGPTRHLTFRPDPAVGLDRATIASTNGGQQIFILAGASNVTFQDLDIVRYTTNANHLIEVTYEGGQNHDNVIERCRIGSVWTTPGAAGFDYLRVVASYGMVVRNNIFFSYVAGNFDRGIEVRNFTDPANSILLYNNVVADHRLTGIVMAAIGTGTVVLRNNAVVNHPAAPAEPFAYRTGVDPAVEVVSSHNVAFASAANVEMPLFAGAQSILGTTTTFLRLDRADAGAAFFEVVWDLSAPWLPNPDFWRLEPEGPLHDEDTDWGQNVSAGAPDPHDQAVHDDIERQFRPGGDVLHTDRGADQIEAGLASDVAERSAGTLWAMPRQNPVSSTLELAFRADRSGRLELDLFDAAGRRVARRRRRVESGETGTFEYATPSGSPQRVLFYRLRLHASGGAFAERRGKVLVR
jgi:hypothetical protein